MKCALPLEIVLLLLFCRILLFAQTNPSATEQKPEPPASYGSGSASDGVFRVGGDVSAPKVLYQPDPEYSEEARKAKYGGTCILWLIVGADGLTHDIRVARSLGLGLDEKAIEAVKRWKFEPAMKDGKPVSVQINISVGFHLYEPSSTSPLDVLSDTMGVDFGPYLQGVLATIRKNWQNLIPSEARAPTMKKGTVSIEFTILADGKVEGVKIVGTSGDAGLDRAAQGGIIASEPFPPLPTEFGGKYLALRIYYYYNPMADRHEPAPLSGGIQNIAPEEMWKRVTQCVFPTHSLVAFNSYIVGTVDIGLGISPEGDVANYRVLAAGQPSLVQSAVDAIRQWKFWPNVVQGEVTWSRVRALVRFNADGTTAVDLSPAILADNFGDPGIPAARSPGTTASTTVVVRRPATAPECKSEPWTGAQAREIEGIRAGTEQVQVSQQVSQGLLLYKVQPIYPDDAKQNHVQGTVVLNAVITKDGRISALHPMSGPKELTAAAVEAVQQWRYKPYMLQGEPVEVQTQITVNFQLR